MVFILERCQNDMVLILGICQDGMVSYSGDVIQCMETVMAPYPFDTVGHCVGQSVPMDTVRSIG